MVSTPATYIPDRGDVVWIDFDPQRGREQAGRRPALVLSPEAYNGLVGLLVLCPITSRRKGYPYEVVIPPGLPVKGIILADQVKSFDWQARNAVFLCQLPLLTVQEVTRHAQTLI